MKPQDTATHAKGKDTKKAAAVAVGVAPKWESLFYFNTFN